MGPLGDIFRSCQEVDVQEDNSKSSADFKEPTKGHMYYVNGVGPVTPEKIRSDSSMLHKALEGSDKEELGRPKGSARSRNKMKAADIEQGVEAGKFFGIGFAVGMCCFFTGRVAAPMP